MLGPGEAEIEPVDPLALRADNPEVTDCPWVDAACKQTSTTTAEEVTVAFPSKNQAAVSQRKCGHRRGA
jgi:hypothetical protein